MSTKGAQRKIQRNKCVLNLLVLGLFAGRRRFLNLMCLCLLPAALLLSSCARLSGPEPDTLRVNLGSEPPSLDWHTSTDSTSFDVLSNIMVGLTQYTESLQVIPAIAKKWDVLDGGKRYVFHLRDDVRWTDGKRVVAGDFEYAWHRFLEPTTAAQYAFFLYGVENVKEFNQGKLKDWSKVGVKAIDDNTFEVRLTSPAAYFIYLTAYAPTYPMRKDMVEKFGNRFTEPGNIITNGPFRLNFWQHEYKIELVSNPDYFEGEPKLKRIKMFMVPEQSTAFALYENNELDYIDNRSISTSDIDRNRNSPEYQSFPVLRNSYLGFNNTKPPFTDHRVIKAISMAIDRTVFPKILRRGEHPLYTWIPPQLPGYSKESGITYDPAAARALLAEAGFKNGQNFPNVEVLYPSREATHIFLQAVQDQLKRNLNIHITLQNMEWKMFLQTLHNTPPPMFVATWGADYPDPETFGNLFVSDNANNDLKYNNPEYDRLIAAAQKEQDPEKRYKLYAKADRIVCVEKPGLAPAYEQTQNIFVKPWVHGISKNAIDLQFFQKVTIDSK